MRNWNSLAVAVFLVSFPGAALADDDCSDGECDVDCTSIVINVINESDGRVPDSLKGYLRIDVRGADLIGRNYTYGKEIWVCLQENLDIRMLIAGQNIALEYRGKLSGDTVFTYTLKP